MLNLLFVYGTLRKDILNSRFHVLAQEACTVRLVGRGRVPGRLFRLDGYPGLAPSGDPGRWVRGELYALEPPEELDGTLSRLDAYEGCGPNDPEPHEYERVVLDVLLESEAIEKAWVYVYKGTTANRQEIRSGDYAEESF